jgi:hypothetical protein
MAAKLNDGRVRKKCVHSPYSEYRTPISACRERAIIITRQPPVSAGGVVHTLLSALWHDHATPTHQQNHNQQPRLSGPIADRTLRGTTVLFIHRECGTAETRLTTPIEATTFHLLRQRRRSPRLHSRRSSSMVSEGSRDGNQATELAVRRRNIPRTVYSHTAPSVSSTGTLPSSISPAGAGVRERNDPVNAGGSYNETESRCGTPCSPPERATAGTLL